MGLFSAASAPQRSRDCAEPAPLAGLGSVSRDELVPSPFPSSRTCPGWAGQALTPAGAGHSRQPCPGCQGGRAVPISSITPVKAARLFVFPFFFLDKAPSGFLGWSLCWDEPCVLQCPCGVRLSLPGVPGALRFAGGTEAGMSFPLLLLGKAACLAVLLPPKASIPSPAPLLSRLEC